MADDSNVIDFGCCCAIQRPHWLVLRLNDDDNACNQVMFGANRHLFVSLSTSPVTQTLNSPLPV